MLHIDLFGYVNFPSIWMKRHFLVIIDDYSSYTWVYLLNSKDDAVELIKGCVTRIENQLDVRVKVMRSDNGIEFKNSVMTEFCLSEGIRRQFSEPQTPKQNGVAERRKRALIETVRTILVYANLPLTLWAEAINTACYVQNRVVVNKRTNVQEESSEKKVDLDKLWSKTADNKAEYSFAKTSLEIELWNEKNDNLEQSPVQEINNKEQADDQDNQDQDKRQPDFESLFQSLNFGNDIASTSQQNGDEEAAQVNNETTDLVIEEADLNDTNIDSNMSLEQLVQTSFVKRNHPPENINRDIHEGVTRRASVYANICLNSCFLSQIEPKNILQELKDNSKPRGYLQEQGIDFEEVFAPVERLEASRIFLAYAASNNIRVFQMIVKSDFINGKIEEKVYVTQPPGVEDP
ncbi:uncharacterized protein LOC143605853 [Bidens hawaiensis]|uniref:uncharacterized protein LOC143605853 n=1 Tax=Bidens hawaiensis TaxID=980011 RepID=UPI00404B66AB